MLAYVAMFLAGMPIVPLFIALAITVLAILIGSFFYEICDFLQGLFVDKNKNVKSDSENSAPMGFSSTKILTSIINPNPSSNIKPAPTSRTQLCPIKTTFNVYNSLP
jgi:hypothetical protein